MYRRGAFEPFVGGPRTFFSAVPRDVTTQGMSREYSTRQGLLPSRIASGRCAAGIAGEVADAARCSSAAFSQPVPSPTIKDNHPKPAHSLPCFVRICISTPSTDNRSRGPWPCSHYRNPLPVGRWNLILIAVRGVVKPSRPLPDVRPLLAQHDLRPTPHDLVADASDASDAQMRRYSNGNSQASFRRHRRNHRAEIGGVPSRTAETRQTGCRFLQRAFPFFSPRRPSAASPPPLVGASFLPTTVKAKTPVLRV